MSTLLGFHHVKLPVADVPRSRDWYVRVFELGVELEFVEEGALMGVALRDPGGGVCLALRRDPARAGALAGFDPITLAVTGRSDLELWERRFDDLSERHGGIVAGHEGWALVGLRDPDGIEVRLYTLERHHDSSPR